MASDYPFARPDKNFYDDVLLVDESGGFLGFIATETLFKVLNALLLTNIRELEGALLARSVSQVDLAFVFANYALEAGIDTNSALIVEKGKSLYIEFLVARPDNINDPGLQKLAKALNSDDVRQFILTRYKGQIAPGF